MRRQQRRRYRHRILDIRIRMASRRPGVGIRRDRGQTPQKAEETRPSRARSITARLAGGETPHQGGDLCYRVHQTHLICVSPFPPPLSHELSPKTDPPSTAICLDLIDEDEKIRELQCGHVYHSACLNLWVERGHHDCPLCKFDILGLQQGEDPPDLPADTTTAAGAAAAEREQEQEQEVAASTTEGNETPTPTPTSTPTLPHHHDHHHEHHGPHVVVISISQPQSDAAGVLAAALSQQQPRNA